MLSNLWKYAVVALTVVITMVMFSKHAGAVVCNDNNSYKISDRNATIGNEIKMGLSGPNGSSYIVQNSNGTFTTTYRYSAKPGQELWVAVSKITVAGTTLRIYQNGSSTPIYEYDSANTPRIGFPGSYSDPNIPGEPEAPTISVSANVNYCFVTTEPSSRGQVRFRIFDVRSHALEEFPKTSDPNVPDALVPVEFSFDNRVLPRMFEASVPAGNPLNFLRHGFLIKAKDESENVMEMTIYTYEKNDQELLNDESVVLDVEPNFENSTVIDGLELTEYSSRDYLIIVVITGELLDEDAPIMPMLTGLITQAGGGATALVREWVSVASCQGPGCNKVFNIISDHINPKIHYLNRATTATTIHVLNNNGVLIGTPQIIPVGADPAEYNIPSVYVGYQVILSAQAASTHLLKLR
ncbi:MAG: hypothetical protein LBM75_01525 [Myxococcales bacterium]|jgi:hypothetical protein|nr:hypothetical protein [Myxococcales bacterium]